MDVSTVPSRERLLDPISRISEVLFGLIMALTFTVTISAATAGHEEIRTLLIGVIGCNIAWGLVDAVMFLLNELTERGHSRLALQAVHNAVNAEAAYATIKETLPPLMASVLTRDDLERVRQRLQAVDEVPETSLSHADWLKALAIFLLVFLSTFPVVIPFIVFRDVQMALRISNLVALVMMFVAGSKLARYGGHSPLRAGMAVMALGVVLVAITIALGG
jgi:VIT1/CCC1 family predicted Fe2+/Mn2+ transporter